MSVPDRRGEVWDFEDEGIFLVVRPPQKFETVNEMASNRHARRVYYVHECIRLDDDPSVGNWKIMEDVDQPLEDGDYHRIG